MKDLQRNALMDKLLDAALAISDLELLIASVDDQEIRYELNVSQVVCKMRLAGARALVKRLKTDSMS